MRMSVSGRLLCTASSMSWAVMIGTSFTPSTGFKATGPEIRVTSAPLSMASRAMA